MNLDDITDEIEQGFWQLGGRKVCRRLLEKVQSGAWEKAARYFDAMADTTLDDEVEAGYQDAAKFLRKLAQPKNEEAS